MSVSERRIPHITVESLRRQLREADEDRFRLRSELASRDPGQGRLLWVLFLVAAAGAPTLRTAPATSPHAGVLAATPIAHTVSLTASRQPSLYLREVNVSRTDARRIKSARVPKANVATITAHDLEHVARALPRPRHPGEFGRKLLSD
jgi:hypothetical protein